MSQKERRHFSGEEKVKMLRMHLLEGKAVSAVCEEYDKSKDVFPIH